MCGETNRHKIIQLITELGKAARGPGIVYLVGGSSMVLQGWRDSTIDLDLKIDPEPSRILDAIAVPKDAFDVNIELAAPDQFIPELPGWRERSQFIDRIGEVNFYHYDFYAQALAKLERGHDRDLQDVRHLISSGLVDRAKLRACFETIEIDLIRFPSIHAGQFRRAVESASAPQDEDSA